MILVQLCHNLYHSLDSTRTDSIGSLLIDGSTFIDFVVPLYLAKSS